MNILDKIIAHKRKEVEVLKNQISIASLESSVNFKRAKYSFRQALSNKNASGIIAEFKRQSPSKGIINDTALPEIVTAGYQNAGASALSILTDSHFFGGNIEDVISARIYNSIPILRKDFMVDEFQIIEAKSIGADVILLIAACLSKAEIKHFTAFAQNLGLEVLLEIHAQEELEKIPANIDVVGINNRNLKTFKVSIEHSIELFHQLPKDMIRISESGISQPKTVFELKKVGFQGFLMGEHFMKTSNPVETCQTFIQDVKNLETQLV